MSRTVRALAIAAAAFAFLLLPTEPNFLAPGPALAASGATNVSPLNYNFDAPSYTTGTPPSNNNFESGDLTGWTVIQGTVTATSGGPTGSTYYASMGNGSHMSSSAFSVPSNGQILNFDRTFVDGSDGITVKVAAGPSYNTWTQVYFESSGPSQPWETKSFNVTQWAGQSIKLRFEATGSVGIDNTGVVKVVHPSWTTWMSGSSYSHVPELLSDGPTGNYSKLTNGEKLWTGTFTVPANGTTQAQVRRTFFNGSTGLAIYVLSGTDFATATLKYLESSASAKPWEVKSSSVAGAFDLSSWAGQSIKLRLQATSNIGVDDVVMNFTSAAAAPSKPVAKAGDPVDTTSGAFTHSHTDIVIPGRGVPLEFTRSYSSMSMVNGTLGHRWTHNYAWALNIESDGDATITYPSGGTARFDWVSNAFTAPAGTFDTLVRTGTSPNYTYTLTTKSQIKYEFTGSTPALTAIKDRNNNTTTLTYTSGLLTSVNDPGGRSLTFSYDGLSRIYRVTDPLPSPDTRKVEFTYDGNGDLWKVKDVKADPTNGPFTVYAYSNHRMTSLTDSNGHVASQNAYDDANRVAEQLDALSNRTCFYYGMAYATTTNCTGVSPAPAEGETVMVNPRGHKTTYGFDTTFRTTDITDHNGDSVHYDFDSSSNITCVTDQRGKKTAYDHDTKGNVTEMIDALNTDSNCALESGGVKWTYTYTANNDIDLETDPLGRQTDYIYDSTGNLTRIARKNSGGTVKALTCFERDSSGQVTATVQSTNLTIPSGATDPCTGNKTLLGYDTYGNMTCTVNARFTGSTTCASDPGKKATFIYDLGGRLLYTTNELTNNSKPVKGSAPEIGSQCGTDGLGNGTNDDSSDDSTVDDGCPSSKFTYDAQNNVLTVTDALANVTTSAYDAKGNLTSVKDANRKTAGATAESGTSQCGTDGTGDGENDDTSDDSVVDEGCLSVVYKYDNGDRLEKAVQAAVSTTSIPATTYGYDANGNRTSVTNPKRQAVGTAESGSQCGTAGTGNDTDEDSDTVKDDGCPSTKHAYDNLDRLESTTDALARVTSYEYDDASNLIERTDARSLVTEYTPDDLNRLDLIEHWNGETLIDSVDYTYNAVGFRTQMVDPTGTTTYTPDDLNRISSVTFPGPKTVSYSYDDAPGGSAADYPGQRTKITYPDSKTVDYTYLADGRMSTVTDWLTKQTAYSYDDAGRLTKTQLPNGVYAHNRYDAADRLTCVLNDKTASAPTSCTSGTVVSKFEYTMDPVGNRTQMVDGGGTHSYQYDPLYRLTQVTYPGPQTDTYTYDANGNRLTKNSTAYTYDAADEMTATGGVTYGYDNNGNQTSRGSDTFGFDHENRLTSTSISSVSGTYTYSGDGLRAARNIGGTNVSYTWDVAGGLSVVLQDSQGNTYVYGLDLISRTDSGGNQEYYAYDGLGSTTEVTGGTGTTVASYSYNVFGAIRSQTGSSVNEFKFTGEQVDSTSLQYLRARYYDPAIGRFLAQDPIMSGHPYGYVGNNPVNLIDPLGLCGWSKPWNCADEGADVAADVAVFVQNAPITAAGVGWGELNGGECDINGDLLIVCSSMSGRAPRGGIMIGNAFLTERETTDIPELLLDHEKGHSRQWAVFGIGFPPLYYANELVGWPLPGPSVCWNFFEWQAGFDEGGYDECKGNGLGSNSGVVQWIAEATKTKSKDNPKE